MRHGYFSDSGIVGTAPEAGTVVNQPTRIVGVETILQTITRAYLENYKILFYDSNNQPIVIYTFKDDIKVNYIDLQSDSDSNNYVRNVAIASTTELQKFLREILYRNLSEQEKIKFEGQYSIRLPDGRGFYDTLTQYGKFYEFFGVYYQNDNEDIPDAMKYEKRIITYKAVN